MGAVAAASTGWLIRKRPSRETMYCCLVAPAPGGATVTGNSGTVARTVSEQVSKCEVLKVSGVS